LEYVDKNREKILADYPEFAAFKGEFAIGDQLMNEFFDYVKTEDPEFEIDKKALKTSEKLLKLRMKAKIAQDLWGYAEFYEIYNETNEILQRAIEIIESDEYKESGISSIE
jgi:carboxyl-terminal processing protease